MTGPADINSETYLAALCRAVPFHVVERVLENPTESSLGPQRMNATVLFADLAGFTSLCERIANEAGGSMSELKKLLDRLFTRVQFEALFPFGGRVLEFAGDAMAVLFPEARHAVCAASAALSILEIVNDEAQIKIGDEVQSVSVRIGLSTGAVGTGTVGDLARRLTVISGQAMHGAIALQPQAARGECVADAATHALWGENVDATELKPGLWRVESVDSSFEPLPIIRLGDRIKTDVARKIALLEPFVAEPLARRLRSVPDGWRIEPEVRRAVVVFADVEDMVGIDGANFRLGSVVGLSLLRAFQKHDGVVLKCTTTPRGHRLMVLFGIYRPSDNDAERAILACLEAHARTRAFHRADGENINIRFGVHAGEVFFGAVGSASKHDLTAIGDTVNVAARAVDRGRPGEIICTYSALEPVADRFETSECGDAPVSLKGKSQTVRLVRVHSAAGGRAHYAVRRTRRRLCLGRSREEERLKSITENALRGQGTTIGITGEAGTGKSHLMANVVDRWIEAGGTALVGRCVEAYRGTPLAAAREFFNVFLGLTDGVSDTERAVRIRERIGEFGTTPADAELFALLQPIIRPDGFDETLLDFSDLRSRERVLDAIVRFVSHRTADKKMLYMLEDVQRADTLTLELVRRLARVSHERAALFIVTYRNDPLLADLRTQLDLEIELAPLNRDDSAVITAHDMGAQRVDPRLADFLYQRSKGNPEYVIDTVRFLADRWLLTVEDGEVRTAGVDLEALDGLVPPNWAQVALARLDGLSELERHVLRIATAVGSTFEVPLVERAAPELAPEIVQSAVAGLAQQRIVAAENSPPHSYRFRDEETRRIAYSVIPDSDRRELHRRIADALERLPGGPDNRLAAIAHHRECSGELDVAVQLLERVIERLTRAGLNAEAESYRQRKRMLESFTGQTPKP